MMVKKSSRLTIVSTLLLVPLAILLLTAAGGQEAEGPVEISFMITPADLPDEDIAQFNETHPNIRLVRTEENWTKFVSDAMAGTASDLMRLGSGSDVSYYVERGLFYDMTEMLQNSEKIDFEDIDIQGNIEYRYQDRWYGLGKDYNNVSGITYNRDIFDAAGISYLSETERITYQELYQIAEELTQRNESGNVTTWGYDFSPTWIPFLASDIAYMKGVEIFTPDKTQINDIPEVRDIFKFFAKFPVNDISSNVRNPVPGWSGAAFAADRVGMVQLGYWFGAQLQENEDYEEKYGWAPSPVWEKGGPIVTNNLGVTGVVMYSGTDHPEEAFEVFEWYIAGEIAEKRATTGWGIPPLKSLQDELPRNNEYNRSRLEIALEDAKHFRQAQSSPYITNTMWQGVWTSNIDPLVRGEITEDEFVDNYFEDLNELLEAGAAELQ